MRQPEGEERSDRAGHDKHVETNTKHRTGVLSPTGQVDRGRDTGQQYSKELERKQHNEVVGVRDVAPYPGAAYRYQRSDADEEPIEQPAR